MREKKNSLLFFFLTPTILVTDLITMTIISSFAFFSPRQEIFTELLDKTGNADRKRCSASNYVTVLK